MFANYHTHTFRCQHASGDDRRYIEDAIQNGMKILGFSDHCPWVYPDDYISNIRMRDSETEDYFTSLIKLRDEYQKEITIYIGFESEYIPELLPAQDKLLADYPVDYMILGQHFVSREPAVYMGKVFHEENDLKIYIDSVIEGMKTGRYIYLAHPDLAGFSGSQEIYDKHYRRLCQYMKEHDFPLEINLLGMYLKRHYPNQHFWKLAGEIGCTAILGCDAHNPELLDFRRLQEQGRMLAYQNGLHLIDYLPELNTKL